MPLAELRVVEIGVLPAGAYCARLFADFGADVVKIEPQLGDPGRRAEPALAVAADRSENAYFGFLNARKRSVQIDPRSPAPLHALLAEADVLIDSLDGANRTAYALDHAALRRANPDLVIASVSWFGESGPYRDYAGTDSVCRALAGLVHAIGPQAGPPLPVPDYQAGIVGGLSAFIPLMAALNARRRGRRFEVSVHEASLAIADYNVALAWGTGERDKRWGVNRFVPNFPMGIYPCKQGWLGVTVVTPVQWKAFCELLDMPEVGAEPKYAVNRDRLRDADRLEARFTPKLKQKTAQEWFRLALELRLPFVVVPDMAGLLAQPEHRRRGAFEPIVHGTRSYEAPASPLRLERTPPRRGGEVPALGEHAAQWLRRERAPSIDGAGTPGARPLDGVRVVDVSMGWAGPMATRHLADLGADVIKIEACQYPDWWRGVDNRPLVFEQMLYEKSPYFTVMNRNKRGLTLDLTTEDGVRLVKRLVEGADIVVENYSAGVLPKLGLDYEALRAINERIVMVSMPAFAADGAWRECRAYGSTLEQASGLPSVSGAEGGPPAMNHIAYGDPIGGLNAACAVLIALYHRRARGQGQHIDLSQVECMLPMVAAWLVEQSATGTLAPRLGARHPGHVPHGSFRCRGDDAWVLVAVTDARQWRALCQTIGRHDWALDDALMTAAGRRAREDEIEQAITQWTRVRSADEAMRMLQRAGVAAGAVRVPFDLPRDPHLTARGYWSWIEHPYIGRHPQPGPAYRDSDQPQPVPRHAPTLGEHNRQVLSDVLGLAQTEIERLAASGVIGTKASPPSMRKARAAIGVHTSALHGAPRNSRESAP
ncbi:MAG: CoA transferase [Burkholderiales bacterium]|nr:CoA transferase [Burkholderiales bacterium]